MNKIKIIENKVALVEFNELENKLIVTPYYYDKYFEMAVTFLYFDVEQKQTLEYIRYGNYTDNMSKEHKEIFDKIFELYKQSAEGEE